MVVKTCEDFLYDMGASPIGCRASKRRNAIIFIIQL